MEGREYEDGEYSGAPARQAQWSFLDLNLAQEGASSRPSVAAETYSRSSDLLGDETWESGLPRAASARTVEFDDFDTKTISSQSGHWKLGDLSMLNLKGAHSVTHANLPESRTRNEPEIQPASTTVVHDVNNYVIGTERPWNVRYPILIPTPKVLSNKQNIRVCQRYLQKDYSCLENCHRFHVCLSWILDKCSNVECTKDHSFSSMHNELLAKSFLTSKFTFDHLRDALKKNHEWFRGKVNQYEKEETICPYFVLNRCSQDDCRNLHLQTMFSWEIEINEMWIPFPQRQMDYIEKCYCNPNVECPYFSLIAEEQEEGKDKTVSEVEEDIESDNEERESENMDITEWELLGETIGKYGPVKIDFERMILSNYCSSFKVRRLSTPSDVMSDISVCTRWLWYVQMADSWMFCRQCQINQFSEIALSDFFEKQLQCGETEICFPNGDTMNLYTLLISDHQGDLKARLRRRPAELFPVDNSKDRSQRFPDIWLDEAKSDSLYTITDVPIGNPEFLFVVGMMCKSLNANILGIRRIQNAFLWNAYQLKKNKMIKEFRGNSALLKEQYLFHGTKRRVVDQIYQGNLDWRLYGTNKGNRHGRGTYFAQSAYFSNKFTDRQGVRVIFVAMVLIGDACLGTPSTDFPPMNSATKRPFDTTVNDLRNPTTFVKYNNDDYYPAYAVSFTV